MKQILRILHIISFNMIFIFTSYSQTIPNDSLFLGQKPPGSTPQKFTIAGMISTGYFAAERVAISTDGKEIYYSELSSSGSSIKIKYLKYLNNKWNGPFILFSGYNSPALSPDDKILYYEDSRKASWYSIRTDTSWSTPIKFWTGSSIQHYLQVTNMGNYYLTSNPVLTVNGDISRLKISGIDTSIQNPGFPINSTNNGADFFISRDESFIIFVIRINGSGKFFISYKKINGSWTNPKNLGSPINSQGWNYGPYVTNDNKYLFFTYQQSGTDIYWAKVNNLIDSLKRTNFIPYLKTSIPDQVDTIGHPFNLQFSDTTFIDDDGNNTLTFSAGQSNGTPLPSWLSFNPSTRSFSGIPTASGTITIKVTATDTANVSATCNFNLIVKTQSGINEDKDQILEGFYLSQNYPNPFNPATTIEYYTPTECFVQLKIYNILGQEIKTLVNEKVSPGRHTVNFIADNLDSGLYFYQLRAGYHVQTQKMMLVK